MRRGRAARIGVALLFVALRAGSAQVTVTVDIGASHVEYDGFLPSAAASVSPALRFTTPNSSLAARGTWLGFESGNASVQGLVAGSLFTPMLGRWRLEAGATAGVATYESYANFAHGLIRSRVHLLRRRGGVWLGGTFGRTSYGGDAHPVLAGSTGVWQGVGPVNLTFAFAVTGVGDTTYADLESAAYLRTAKVEIDAVVGVRNGNGGGEGVYGEAVAAVSLTRALAVTAGGGRYPTDPIRGSVAGRYATIGLRFTGVTPRPAPRTPTWPQPPVASLAGSNGHHASATAMVEPDSSGGILTIRAPGAQLVEVMGDFTDWEPVKLQRTADAWRFPTRLISGNRRFNVRIDGGPWIVPQGATIEHDDFDGSVGTIVVP